MDTTATAYPSVYTHVTTAHAVRRGLRAGLHRLTLTPEALAETTPAQRETLAHYAKTQQSASAGPARGVVRGDYLDWPSDLDAITASAVADALAASEAAILVRSAADKAEREARSMREREERRAHLLSCPVAKLLESAWGGEYLVVGDVKALAPERLTEAQAEVVRRKAEREAQAAAKAARLEAVADARWAAYAAAHIPDYARAADRLVPEDELLGALTERLLAGPLADAGFAPREKWGRETTLDALRAAGALRETYDDHEHEISHGREEEWAGLTREQHARLVALRAAVAAIPGAEILPVTRTHYCTDPECGSVSEPCALVRLHRDNLDLTFSVEISLEGV